MIAELIRPSLLDFIKKKVPDLDGKAFICFEDLGEFRKDYVKEVLEDEIGEQKIVLKAIAAVDILPMPHRERPPVRWRYIMGRMFVDDGSALG